MNLNDLGKAALKRIAANTMRDYFGFAPAMSSIKLMEANGDGSYIGFEVNGHGYQIYGKVEYSAERIPVRLNDVILQYTNWHGEVR